MSKEKFYCESCDELMDLPDIIQKIGGYMCHYCLRFLCLSCMYIDKLEFISCEKCFSLEDNETKLKKF